MKCTSLLILLLPMCFSWIQNTRLCLVCCFHALHFLCLMWAFRLMAAFSFLHFHFVSFDFQQVSCEAEIIEFWFFFPPANYKSLSFNGMNSVRCHFCKTRDFASFHFLLLLIYFLAFEDLTTRTLWKNWHILDATWIVIDICITPCDSRGLLWDVPPKMYLFHYSPFILGGGPVSCFMSSWWIDPFNQHILNTICRHFTRCWGKSVCDTELVCVFIKLT